MKRIRGENARSARNGHALQVMQDLARFRYRLRKFLRFSERAARGHGVTPQQHQLMLGVAGFNENDRATISELAEFMQERHNSVVELVGRAVRHGLVRKEQDAEDRRYVLVSLTPHGKTVLSRLAKLHAAEIARLRTGLLSGQTPPRSKPARSKLHHR